MYCNSCNNKLPEGAKFCGKCGTKVVIKQYCAQCGTQLAIDDIFCTQCGAKHGEAAGSNSNQPEAPKRDEFGFEIIPGISDFVYEPRPDSSKLDELPKMPDFDELDELPEMPDFDEAVTDEPVVLPIPEGIKEINRDNIPNALKDKGYTSVIIPEGVVEIGYDAFYGWEKLEKVVLPHSVKQIHSTSFNKCKSLREVVIPNRETYMQSNPFWNCHEALVIHCPFGSYAEKTALERWIKIKYTDRERFEADVSYKPAPAGNGRLCGTVCYNVACNEQNGHEYGGWYYDLFFDNCGFFNLVRFDEDNVNAIDVLREEECKKTQRNDIIIQTNRFGVFVFLKSNVLWYYHDGVPVKKIEMDKLLPNLQSKIKKEMKEWHGRDEYECHLFSSVWVYGQVLYFTTNFDYDKGIIYKCDLSTDEIRHFKITKPRNVESCSISRITGDERYVSFNIDGDGQKRLLDTFTEGVHKTNARYIDFEAKRCYYNCDTYSGENDKPIFTPEGFQNFWLTKEFTSTLNGTQNGEYIGRFYRECLFTGDAFYGFRYGHTKKYQAQEDHYYNLYKVTQNNWSYLNAGSRGGIEEFSIQGNYCYFDTTNGIRAKLDDSGMVRGWTGKTGGMREYGSLMETEMVFRRLCLQEAEFDI